MEEISKDKAKSFQDKCTFFSPFHFLSDFDMDSHDFDSDTLRNKPNVKRSLHNNLDHWYHIDASPFCYWYYRERLKNPIFCYFRFICFFQNKQSALQNEDFLTRIMKESTKLEPIPMRKNIHSKPRLILDFRHVNFFCL